MWHERYIYKCDVYFVHYRPVTWGLALCVYHVSRYSKKDCGLYNTTDLFSIRLIVT